MNDHQYTDQEICCIIRDYDQMIQDIRHRIESLARELWDLDSNDDWLCKLLSLQHQETGTITTHANHRDLSDLLKSKKSKGLQYAKELQEGIEIEMQKMESIQQLYRCYMELPRREHELLCCLYEKAMSWNALQKKYKISKNTFIRRRKNALNMIRKIYSEKRQRQIYNHDVMD